MQIICILYSNDILINCWVNVSDHSFGHTFDVFRKITTANVVLRFLHVKSGSSHVIAS